MPPVLDARLIRAWINLSVEYLAQTRGKMNVANVFPVPDSDTGTNSLLTMKSACDEVNSSPPDAGPITLLAAAARGALLGARGNSGVILSAYLQGLATYAASTDPAAQTQDDTAAQWWVQALRQASDGAYQAVAEPASGTMLSAAKGAAKRARKYSAKPQAHPQGTLRAAAKGARKALLNSPQGLGVLREHGVLDAGAFALTVVLTALYTASTQSVGEDSRALLEKVLHIELGAANGSERSSASQVEGVVARAGEHAAASARELGDLAQDLAHRDYANSAEDLEVMALVQLTGRSSHAGIEVPVVEQISQVLSGNGTSLAVVEGGDFLHIHIHAADSARALHSLQQLEAIKLVHASVRPLHPVDTAGLGMIAVVHELGLMADLARSGVIVLLHGEQGPGQAELRRALEDANAPSGIFLCPNPQIRQTMSALTDNMYCLPAVNDDLDTVLNTVWLQDLLSETIAEQYQAAAHGITPTNDHEQGLHASPAQVPQCVFNGAQLERIPQALQSITATARQVGQIAAAHPDRTLTCVYLACPRDREQAEKLTQLEHALAAGPRGADLVVVHLAGSSGTVNAPTQVGDTLGVLIGEVE